MWGVGLSILHALAWYDGRVPTPDAGSIISIVQAHIELTFPTLSVTTGLFFSLCGHLMPDIVFHIFLRGRHERVWIHVTNGDSIHVPGHYDS